MMRIATNEAQAQLAELVQRASRGETIVITESGQPMAKLIPAGEAAQRVLSEEQALRTLRDIRSRTKLAFGEKLADLIHEGRKHRSW
jgi:prevent-host-death family protein